jgi:hypothetical protein
MDEFDADYSDYGKMLRVIGGWTIGCINHEENMVAVERAKSEGLVTVRIHRAPITPKGWECFELTDEGIEKVRELCGDKEAEGAIKMRQWYRDNAKKFVNA